MSDAPLDLGRSVARAARRHPNQPIELDRPSVIAPELGTSWNAAVLDALVDEVAAQLSTTLPDAVGAAVVVAKSNHLDIQVLAAAAIRAGLTPVLLSTQIPAEEIPTILGRAQPVAVIADRDTALRWELARHHGCVLSLDGPVPAGCRHLRARRRVVDSTRSARRDPAPARDVDAPQLVTHTSGTTGVPKLVVHSVRSMAERVRAQTMPVPVASFRRRDRLAMAITWNHARAVDGLMAVLDRGTSLLAVGTTEPTVVGPLLERFRPTLLETMPNSYLLWEQLPARHPDAFASVRAFLNAFDAIHPRTVRLLLGASRRRMPVWAQAYGQSEAGGITLDVYHRRTVAVRADRPVNLRSMGWRLPFMTGVRVTDVDTGARLGPGRVGQLEVRSQGLAITYLGQEELHRRRRRRGGWWTMGDLGTKSRSGRVVLLDRAIDLVGGVESCLDVEDRLIDRLPELTEVVIVTDPATGRARPVVCTKDDEALSSQRWDEATSDLPQLEAPVQLPWALIPRTATCKVRRGALSEALAAAPGPAPA